MALQNNHWLNGSVLYQIYPRSFQDANGDGIGDLKGVTSRLDYLKGTNESLDVDYIWLSPFYPSPMADFGYDVSSYVDVDPIFGNLDDFRELLTEAHSRDLKVIIDFIPNHTSDKHAWFEESRASRDNPKRDWYVWKDGKPDGLPPNNWLSVFGGDAWEYDEHTGQYYLHSFLKQQPDLNWDNPEVREAMHNQLKFWLDMGVDGFRVDAVSWISKDTEFRDEEINNAYAHDGSDPHNALVHAYSQNGPNLYRYLDEMAELVGSYGERVMITEAYPQDWTDVNAYRKFYDHVNPTVSAPFNFTGIFAPWDATSYKNFIDSFQNSLQPEDLAVYCFGNHDRPRLASRIGQDAAKTAMTLLLTLPGMPTMYYGDELGMTDMTILPEEVQDPFEKNVPGKSLGRDPSRTPMLWDETENAGFSRGKPWLPIHSNYRDISVKIQSVDPYSHVSLTRKLLRIRKNSEALQTGSIETFEANGNVLGFHRATDQDSVIVLLNFGDKAAQIQAAIPQGHILYSTHPRDSDSATGHIELQPYESTIIQTT